jgi:hypothetical protein
MNFSQVYRHLDNPSFSAQPQTNIKNIFSSLFPGGTAVKGKRPGRSDQTLKNDNAYETYFFMHLEKNVFFHGFRKKSICFNFF